MTKAILLTGNGRRHRYMAQQLAQSLDMVGIVSETKAPMVANPSSLPPQDQQDIERHFGERDAVERRYLGDVDAFPKTDVLAIERGEINAETTFDWVAARQPDVVLLYGTGIVKPPLLDAYLMINCHLGLSPYYRGGGTNFWPLVNGEPECVGATIHLAILDVDAGSILGQIRPEPDFNDRAHDLGTKTIIKAAQTIPALVQASLRGELTPQAQDLTIGQVYRRRDFTADAVRKMWQNFDAGMMRDYVKNLPARQAAYPIVEVN